VSFVISQQAFSLQAFSLPAFSQQFATFYNLLISLSFEQLPLVPFPPPPLKANATVNERIAKTAILSIILWLFFIDQTPYPVLLIAKTQKYRAYLPENR